MMAIMGSQSDRKKPKKEYLVKDPRPFDIKIENKYSVVAITGINLILVIYVHAQYI